MFLDILGITKYTNACNNTKFKKVSNYSQRKKITDKKVAIVKIDKVLKTGETYAIYA